MESVKSILFLVMPVVVLAVSTEGMHMPHLFHKGGKKVKTATDGMNKNVVVHSGSAKKWMPNPAFKGRPRWNPMLAKLINRYLSGQSKPSHTSKAKDFNSFVGIFNALHKRTNSIAHVGNRHTFYVRPLKGSKANLMKDSKKSLKLALWRLRQKRRKQSLELKEKAEVRNKRDIPGFGLNAGDHEEVLDPFDANHNLLKWEHGQIGYDQPVANDGRFIDYTDGHYNGPMRLDHFGVHQRPTVVNTNSIGYSGDLFGHDITDGWYRKKRSLTERSERQKRSLYNKDFDQYGMESFANMKHSYDSYENPMKSSTYSLSSMDNGGLLYPLDSGHYYGMVNSPQRRNSDSSSRRSHNKPTGKYLGPSNVDYAFGQRHKVTKQNKPPSFQYPNFADPVVSSSIYGVYPDTKHAEYYGGSKYNFDQFRNSDTVIGTDYHDVNMLPIGPIGYVKTQTANSDTADAAQTNAAPNQVPPAAGAQQVAPSVRRQAARVQPRLATVGRTARTTMKSTLTTVPPTTTVKAAVMTPSPKPIRRKISCCDLCDSNSEKGQARRPCNQNGVTRRPSGTTTPCYKPHERGTTIQGIPHFHNGQYGQSTKYPYHRSTRKSIWSEFEIVGNLGSWLKSSKSPRHKYDELQVGHGSYAHTTPTPFREFRWTSPGVKPISRIVTQSPDGYNYNLVQDIDIKVQHHPNGMPKVTGTVELQENGKNPRFVVKLPFAAGRLPLSIRKLIISRFTPSPLGSGKSAPMKMDYNCAPWNSTCMQEYAEQMKFKDIDIIAELDPELIEKHHLEHDKNLMQELRGSEERSNPFEEVLDFSPEILPDLETDEQLRSEIHSSVPVGGDYNEPYYLPEGDGSDDTASSFKQFAEGYKQDWLSLTTPSPSRVRLESMPSGTPQWLKDIISKFIESDAQSITLQPEALAQQWQASIATPIHGTIVYLISVTLMLSALSVVSIT